MDFDSGVTDGADRHRQGQALQQREIQMDVEPLGLAIGEAIRDGLESLADGIEVIEPFLQTEVAQIIGDSSLRRKREDFSYCLRKEFFQ
jgi:hypothetical protein